MSMIAKIPTRIKHTETITDRSLRENVSAIISSICMGVLRLDRNMSCFPLVAPQYVHPRLWESRAETECIHNAVDNATGSSIMKLMILRCVQMEGAYIV